MPAPHPLSDFNAHIHAAYHFMLDVSDAEFYKRPEFRNGSRMAKSKSVSIYRRDISSWLLYFTHPQGLVQNILAIVGLCFLGEKPLSKNAILCSHPSQQRYQNSKSTIIPALLSPSRRYQKCSSHHYIPIHKPAVKS
jgi:hypothetical protein